MLEPRLRAALPGVEFALRGGDLYSIAKVERDTLLDAMAEGADFPFVLVDGKVVHSGDLSLAPIAEVLRASG